MEKPIRPISGLYADAKQTLTKQINQTLGAYRLPLFMAEGILTGILAELRMNSCNELANENEKYLEDLNAYYEAKEKELQEAFEKEKEALIQAFENPSDPDDFRKVSKEEEILNTEETKISGETIIEEVD